ncbi:MAG TPA: nuclear transport factor 2 family protein [Stellaceae bacterium]|nr:nuclear transport factor 2 family protein [Stellaceae bacterium]
MPEWRAIRHLRVMARAWRAPGRAAMLMRAYPRSKKDAVMTDSDAVLAANLEFYRAFTMRDIAAMDQLWARRAPVACLHPGWIALTDRAAIISSWSGILSSPGAPQIACFDERVLMFGDTALVLCEEELDGGTLAASNFFVREDGAWRLAHHHAGQIVRRQTESRRRSQLN